jgi:hypothetical protein
VRTGRQRRARSKANAGRPHSTTLDRRITMALGSSARKAIAEPVERRGSNAQPLGDRAAVSAMAQLEVSAAAAEPPWPSQPPMDFRDWRRFARYPNYLAAHIVAGLLESEGVPTVVESWGGTPARIPRPFGSRRSSCTGHGGFWPFPRRPMLSYCSSQRESCSRPMRLHSERRSNHPIHSRRPQAGACSRG